MTEIIWLDSTDSTNAQARKRISELGDMDAIAADLQTAGRGQGGHRWHSAAGMNLTVSFVLKGTGVPPQDQGRISERVVVGVCNYLKSKGIQPSVKLPNDIWVGGSKICGLLMEHAVCGSAIEWTIAGIGLNLNETAFPADLPNPTSVRLLTGLTLDPKKEAEILREEIRLADSDDFGRLPKILR